MTSDKAKLHEATLELHKRQLASNKANRDLESIKSVVAKLTDEKYADKKKHLHELREKLSHVTPAEWLDKLAKIKSDDIRIRAAQIVWWDFFSTAKADKRTTAFDGLLEEFQGLNSRADTLEKKIAVAKQHLADMVNMHRAEHENQVKAICGALVHAGYGRDLSHARMYSESEEKEGSE